MNAHVTPGATEVPSEHPLATELVARIAAAGAGAEGLRLLLLGIGRGRSIPPFLAAGVRVDVVEGDPARAAAAIARFAAEPRVRILGAACDDPHGFAHPYDGALSTHALLHGTPSTIAAAVAATGARVRPEAPFYATFGSTRDPRFGAGRRIDDSTFAPLDGSEAGILHAYFDASGVRALARGFTIESLVEVAAAAHVGRWAHTDFEAEGIVHWFLRARRTQTS